MPELPEVETVRRILAEKITHETIRDVFVYHEPMIKDGMHRFMNVKARQSGSGFDRSAST